MVHTWFDAEPTSVPLARAWAAEQLAGAPAGLVDDAVLCVSELSANAVLHARTPFQVAITRDAGLVRLAVHDGNGTIPVAKAVASTDRTGRGLSIVDAVVERWGVDDEPPTGKTIWCELRWPGRAAGPAAGAPEISGR